MKKFFLFIITAGMSAVMISCAKQEASPLQAGTVVRDTLMGVPCCIYLPDNYKARVQKTHEVFPVLYLQHGMYGSEDDWTTQGRLVHWMDSLLRCGAVREMVVVMPDNFLGSIPPAEREALMAAPDTTPSGEAFDTSKGSAHWRKFTREQERGYEMSGYWESRFPAFMAEAEQRYSISSEPSQRAIAGLSMGGFHTMHVSHFLHGQFACVGLFSAVVFPPVSAEAYDNWQEEVRALMADNKLYWIGMGREDFLYEPMQEYRRWLEENHLEYTYYESAGGHTWDNWQDYLCRFLQKL
ncbi:MAG: hypothetical protein IJQ06_02620 [Paludibacteraceae bacterium]|nr:hypothetical protein [Paludibacteraceae bacterium]